MAIAIYNIIIELVRRKLRSNLARLKFRHRLFLADSDIGEAL